MKNGAVINVNNNQRAQGDPIDAGMSHAGPPAGSNC